MLTPGEISSALSRTLDEGRALALVSVIERDGSTPARPARLLVAESEGACGGALGNPMLDELAVRHALELIRDERREIEVIEPGKLAGADAIDPGSPERSLRLLFEINRPPLELIVCGGGHVGQAVAKAARLLDFRITVIDDRADFASREKFPDPAIRLLATDFVEALRGLRITPASHIVIVTRGHRHDEICLREVIDKPARYIGMIGSRRRTTTIRERLRREGIAPDLLHRVHAPIGLDIGALTPEEIALAILAETVLIRRGGSGRPKSAEGPMARAR